MQRPGSWAFSPLTQSLHYFQTPFVQLAFARRRHRFRPAIGAVFGFEAVLHDLKLERPDGAEQRDALDGIGQLKLLGHSCLEQLVESLADCAGVSARRVWASRHSGRARGINCGQIRLDASMFQIRSNLKLGVAPHGRRFDKHETLLVAIA